MTSTSTTPMSATSVRKRIGRPPGSKNKPKPGNTVANAVATKHKAQLNKALREIQELRKQLRTLQVKTERQALEAKNMESRVSRLWLDGMVRHGRISLASARMALMKAHAGPSRTLPRTEGVRLVAPTAQMVPPSSPPANQSL
ncbi:hypothetical protein MBLNU457_1298t1 [Dothideomycetes sp. NU457]